MTTATARTRIAISRVGRLRLEPRRPSRAPRMPKPTMRPTLKARCGRMRCANDGTVVPGRGELGGVRRRDAEHQSADHGHAGGHACGEAQREGDEQAAAARVGEAGEVARRCRRPSTTQVDPADRERGPRPRCATPSRSWVSQRRGARARSRRRGWRRRCRSRLGRCVAGDGRGAAGGGDLGRRQRPGSVSSALVTRLSQAAHVIPVIGIVRALLRVGLRPRRSLLLLHALPESGRSRTEPDSGEGSNHGPTCD